MIRTIWAALVAACATLWYGGRAIVAAILGHKEPERYAALTRGWARAILRGSGCRVVVHGEDELRAGGGCVVVSNHVSWYDVFAIAASIPGPYHFVAKKELEGIPFFGRAWKAAGHISIDRSDRMKAISSLRTAGEKIRGERSAVIIFPEGTRSRTGRLQPFKKGAFMLAVEAHVPVVPTVVVGSYDIMRPDTFKVHPATIHLYFRTPIDTQAVTSDNVDQLMAAVRTEMVAVLDDTESLPPLEPSAA